MAARGGFLSEDSECGMHLLHIVAQGSSILAELQRLSKAVPDAFVPGTPASTRYAPLVFNLKYLSNSEMYETKINADLALSELDEEFAESYGDVVSRFYKLFKSILVYHEALKEFLADLKAGVYIQHTLEDVLRNFDGKQLMCEAAFLLGVMLLMLDLRIHGPVREALIVAHVRIEGEGSLEDLEEVARLCKHSGWVPGDKRRAPDYAGSLLGRVPLPLDVVGKLLMVLRSDDVYEMTRVYKAPEMRSAALARQAAIVYVLLYFNPPALEDAHIMSEVVTKHFEDNWVVPLYMGLLVDLTVEWAPFKAASAALAARPLAPATVRHWGSFWSGMLAASAAGIAEYSTEGILTDQFVIDQRETLLQCLRQANAALRWLLLQRRTSHAKTRKILEKEFPIDMPSMLQHLMRTASLERRVRDQVRDLLGQREDRWAEERGRSVEMLRDLAAYFGGDVALSRVAQDDGLRDHFAHLAAQVEALDIHRSLVAGRTIQSIIKDGLGSVLQYEAIDTSTQVKEFIAATEVHLTSMVRVVNLQQGLLDDMDAAADLSWAWGIMGEFIPHMHSHIQARPSSVQELRSVFLKLTSVLDVPVERIMQAESPDAASVAEFYSSQLIAFVRRVLGIIPRVVFQLLASITRHLEGPIGNMPPLLEVVHLPGLAEVDARHEIAFNTHRISVFTEGVMSMKETMLGVIQMDPRQLLHEGITKFIVDKITEALHGHLAFDLRRGRRRDPLASVKGGLHALRGTLEKFKQSLEYVQDYVDMYGLKVWQQELGRVLAFYTEQECNRFLKKKVLPAASVHQSSACPIPLHLDEGGSTFMGRMASALIELAEPGHALYSPAAHGWVAGDGSEVLGLTFFSLMHGALGTPGLTGVDRVLAFNVGHLVDRIFKGFHRTVQDGGGDQLKRVVLTVGPPGRVSPAGVKGFASALKSFKFLPDIAGLLVDVGRSQLLRLHLQHQLLFSCRLDSNLLFNALRTMNDALMRDVRRHYADPDTAPYPARASPLLPELSKHVEAAGLGDPMAKIYSTAEALPWFGVYLGCVVLHAVGQLEYDGEVATLIPARRAKHQYDGLSLVAGVGALLRQLHPDVAAQFLAFTAHFTRTAVHEAMTARSPSVPTDVPRLLWVITALAALGSLPTPLLHRHFPPHILATLNVS